MTDISYVCAQLPEDSAFHIFLCVCNSRSFRNALPIFTELLVMNLRFLIERSCLHDMLGQCYFKIQNHQNCVSAKGESYLFSISFWELQLFPFLFDRFRSYSALFPFFSFSLLFYNVLFQYPFLLIIYFIIPLSSKSFPLSVPPLTSFPFASLY